MFKLKLPVLPQLQSALLTLALAAAAQADWPRIVLDYVDAHGSGMNMNVPDRPLTESTLERWAAILNASDAQLRYLRAEHARYIARHNAFLDREAPRYLAKCRGLSEVVRQEGLSTPAFARQGHDVDRANAALRRQITAIEHAFIESMEPILSFEQLGRVTTLRNESTRRNCRIVEVFARWADTELRSIWEDVAATVASPDEAARVGPVLDDYEARLTRLVCRQADRLFTLRAGLTENRIARLEGRSPDEARARYRQLMSEWGHGWTRVRLLHEQTVERIVESVSSVPGEVFITAVKQDVFPELDPDPTALHALLDALRDDALMGNDAHIAVERIAQGYQLAYSRACLELEAFCTDWGENSVRGVSGYQNQFLPEALAPLLEKRAALSRDWLERLEMAIGAEALARHGELIPAGLKDDEPAQ